MPSPGTGPPGRGDPVDPPRVTMNRDLRTVCAALAVSLALHLILISVRTRRQGNGSPAVSHPEVAGAVPDAAIPGHGPGPSGPPDGQARFSVPFSSPHPPRPFSFHPPDTPDLPARKPRGTGRIRGAARGVRRRRPRPAHPGGAGNGRGAPQPEVGALRALRLSAAGADRLDDGRASAWRGGSS